MSFAIPLVAQEVFVFLAGCCFGSFYNVLVHRLPVKESIIRPGSHCPRCGHPISFYDNIPLLSYLILRGRCRLTRAVAISSFVMEKHRGDEPSNSTRSR